MGRCGGGLLHGMLRRAAELQLEIAGNNPGALCRAVEELERSAYETTDTMPAFFEALGTSLTRLKARLAQPGGVHGRGYRGVLAGGGGGFKQAIW
jgi:hypothetical protein